MTENEARELLRAHGWVFQMRSVAGVYNVYACKNGEQVYLCPLASLDQQTQESLLAMLNEEERHV